MKYSKIFGKTSKNISSEQTSLNAQLLIRGGFVRPQMAGVYNYLPLGLRVLKKIENIVREELNNFGAQEILMPALSNLESWKITHRQDIDVLFHLEGHDQSQLVLNPTHEEVITPLVGEMVFSYQDLPLGLYQIQTKFRNEPRAKSGLLRGREFLMKDLYSFHPDQNSLEKYYQQMTEVYFQIYQKLSLKDQTVLTYASGGAFSKYSHEFQVLAEVGEDTIHLCPKCRLAVNQEIITDQPDCPKCHGPLEPQRAVEVGNIFKLGTRFSQSFNFYYQDQNGDKKLVEMGCYGIGISRLMGILVEIFHDDRGIIWPQSVAPFRVHLISLADTQEKAEAIYQKLTQAGIEVLWDDRTDVSAGIKFADADLIGIPVRLVVSPKTQEQIEWKERNLPETKLMSLDQVLDALS